MAQYNSKSYKGRAVVLHSLKYGDSSLIVHLFTDVVGRQSYIVQGVRSAKGRGSKAALFQPFFGVEFEALQPSRSDLHKFREVHSGIVLCKTPFDIRRSTIALFCAEVIYRLVQDGEQNVELFNFVWDSIKALDSIEEGGVANFHLWFLANLSRQIGFMPSGEWQEDAWFDIKEGEYTPVKPSHKEILERDKAKLLSSLVDANISNISAIKLSREQRVEMLESLIRYYNYHLEFTHKIESISVLREIF